MLDVIVNQGFPIALSILLIFRIDKFMQEIVSAQKKGYRQILENTKEIHNTITRFYILQLAFFSYFPAIIPHTYTLYASMYFYFSKNCSRKYKFTNFTRMILSE